MVELMSDIEEKAFFESIFNAPLEGVSSIDSERKEKFFEHYINYKDEIPFDIVKFARELGLNLFASKKFTNDQSGQIVYDSISKNYSIYINENHSLNRKVFTLAHEVGHFFCDKDYLEKNKIILEDANMANMNFLNRTANVEDSALIKREVRANKFAAEILIPTNKFIEIYFKTSGNLEEIAKKFRVSIDAVRIRASNVLGVIL